MADSPLQSDPATELSTFFDSVWGGVEGYVYLPLKQPETGQWVKVFFEWPAKKQSVIRHVLGYSIKQFEVYFAPAIFSATEAKKENVVGTNVLWCDFDGNAPAWEAQNGTLSDADPTQAVSGSEAVAAPHAAVVSRVDGVPAPSIRVRSSEPGHEHDYWILDNFTSDVEFIENANRSLAYKLDADSSGWDATQVLRPPFTTNYKRDKPVEIQEFNDLVYSTDAFVLLPKITHEVTDKLDVSLLPEVESVLAYYNWDKQHFALYQQTEIEYGKRSSAIMQMAYFACEIGMSDLECYALIESLDLRWGKFRDRTDREHRLKEIVNKARLKHPRPITDTNFAGLLETGKADKFAYNMQELLDSELHIEWAIEGLIEMQGLGIVASLPGVGKTQWSLRLAMAQAMGKPFLKWDCKVPRRVLYFSLEMNHPAIKEFVKNMVADMSADERSLLKENLIIVPFGETIPLDSKEGQSFFQKFLDEYQPAGIFIDSMGKLSNSELTDEKKIKELNAYYAKIRKAYGCYLWFVHHNRKPNGDNKKPKALADLYGNQYIAAETSVAISLWKEDDIIEVDTIKSRLVSEGKPVYVRRTKNLDFEIVEGPIANNLLREVRGDDKSRIGSFEDPNAHGI